MGLLRWRYFDLRLIFAKSGNESLYILYKIIMAINYTLKDKESIEAKVTFLRIAPNGKRQTLDDIFTKLSDLSWINRMTPPALHKSFEVRAKRTLDKLVEIINNSATLSTVDAVVTDWIGYRNIHPLGYIHLPLFLPSP
jgi:hypothetical protein